MNPYDPNDALSDKSDEYSRTDTLTTIDEYPEFPIQEINAELERLRSKKDPKVDAVFSGDEFVGGDVTSEDTNYAHPRFKDPNNEIDYEGPSGENDDRKIIDDILQKYLLESDAEDQPSATNDAINNQGTHLTEIHEIFQADDPDRKTIELKESSSVELIQLLEDAKSLFETPTNQVTVPDVVDDAIKPSCPITSSGMELLEIEAKLRECHLVKPQMSGKQDVRLNQLTLRDKYSKPEVSRQEITSSTNAAADNFCDLLYKSTLMSNADNVELLQNIQQEESHSKSQASTLSSETTSKLLHIDDYAVLSRAVQLLESRTSSQNIPDSCRGILGILALQQKLKELFNNKEELETRLYKCNSDFMEFIDILSDKARIIAINNKEVDNYIKILNLKVPELEKVTASHTESLEDIKYRFKERNVAKMIELRKQVEFYSLNIEKLNRRIAKASSDNMETKKQMDNLDIENLNYKTYFMKKIEEVRANMENLESLNSDLQRQLEVVQNSDLGKNENFKLKVPSLKEEIESISNNIREVRREKYKFEMENTDLRRKLKQLIVAKVMEKRSTGTTAE